MEGRLKTWKNSRNVFKLLQHRENSSDLGKVVKQYYQFTDSFVKRLGLETELQGHEGCVNCLEWSANGLRLASGSDDTNVIYWDPFRHKQIQTIPTPHIGNIFSVKFLDSNDSIIATGAGDCRVIVQSVEDALAKNAPLLDCSCHVARVKRLATSPEQPMLFWSAGEDGLVLQYDLREPHECPAKSKVFLDLSYTTEIKCIAVNPTKPNMIAVGANDCFVRLYDRRKVKVSSINANISFDPRSRVPPEPQDSGCVQYFAPGHLARENSRVTGYKLATTYIAFNNAGTEMLVNMGCEQIYLFDVNSARHVNQLKIPQCLPKMRGPPLRSCCSLDGCLNLRNVNINNKLEIRIDSCACDYIKRAKQLFVRKWMGDLYAAARDFLHVIQRWPDYKSAYIGLLACLVELKWKREAIIWLEHFLKLYPDEKTLLQISTISKDIEELASTPVEGVGGPDVSIKVVPEDEQVLRLDSFDYEKRFLGHCNTTTDIKEANFLGENGDYICAGSDDGIIFIWNRKNCEVATALWGDYSIVNCIQPHPSACFLASSGIDSAVKLWSPCKEDGELNSRVVCNISTIVKNNQARLAMDPFETMLANMGYRIRDGPYDSIPINETPSCRTS